MHSRSIPGLLCALLLFFMYLASCGPAFIGGGSWSLFNKQGDKPGDVRPGGEIPVGGDGVFGSTYYKSNLDFSLTVPESWTVDVTGEILSFDKSLKGQISSARSAGGTLDLDVANYHEKIRNGSLTYEEESYTSLEIDGESARIVDCSYRLKGPTATDQRSVVVHIEKGNLTCRVEFKSPSSKWNQGVADQVRDTIHGITRQGTLLGQLRRVCNQYEWAYESRNLGYYWFLIADSIYRKEWLMGRAEMLRRVRIDRAWKKRVYDGLYPVYWELGFWNLRRVRKQGDLISVLVDFTAYESDQSGNRKSGEVTRDHRVTFITERGQLRLSGWSNKRMSYGTNLGESEGQILPGSSPVPVFSYRRRGRTLSVDANASRDLDTSASELNLRWDWDGNGSWDPPWSTTRSASHKYPSSGTRRVRLQVRDGDGMLSVIARTLSLGGDTITNTIGMKLTLLPVGKFQMGAYKGEKNAYPIEYPKHKVTLTKPFYLGQTEVTQGQWYAVMKTKPWEKKSNVKVGADYGASYISWSDADKFCKQLSQLEKVTYRLPTEAEWEYACRGDTTTRFSYGDDLDNSQLKAYAWYRGNALGANAHLVGQRNANPWGLFDMHGNVWEWCSDRYPSQYSSAAQTDPGGPLSGMFRVVRGGSWRSDAWICRSAFRHRGLPSAQWGDSGFRVARSSN